MTSRPIGRPASRSTVNTLPGPLSLLHQNLLPYQGYFRMLRIVSRITVYYKSPVVVSIVCLISIRGLDRQPRCHFIPRHTFGISTPLLNFSPYFKFPIPSRPRDKPMVSRTPSSRLSPGTVHTCLACWYGGVDQHM